MPVAEVVGKWKSRRDFQGGLGRRLFHNLFKCPEWTANVLSPLAGFRVTMNGRIGVTTEDRAQIPEFWREYQM